MSTVNFPATYSRAAPTNHQLRWILLSLVHFTLAHTLAYGVDLSNPSGSHQIGRSQINRSTLVDRPLGDQANGADQSPIQVQLSYGINVDRKALITCEVITGEDTETQGVMSNGNRVPVLENPSSEWPPMSALYLLCPQVTTSVCYMDCTPSCVLGENGCHVPETISQVIERCTYERPSSTRLLVSYVINLESLNISGQWNCDYQGQRAIRSLDLRAAERRKTTEPSAVSTQPLSKPASGSGTAVMSITTTEKPIQMKPKELTMFPFPVRGNDKSTVAVRNVEVATATKVVGSASATQSHSNETPSNHFGELSGNGDTAADRDFQSQSDVERRQVELFNWKLTRPELVAILIISLILSLLVNVVLSVRCALTKSYLDNLSQGKLDPCLERVLCFNYPRKSSSVHNRSDLIFGSIPNGTRPDLPCTVFPHYAPSTTDRSSCCMPETMLFFPSPTVNGTNGPLTQLYAAEGGTTLTLTSPSLHPRSIALPDMVTGSNGPMTASSPLYGKKFVNFGPCATNAMVSRASPYGSNGLSGDGVEGLVHKGVTCANTGSLTNSIILTSDSASYNDGIGINGPSYLLIPSTAQTAKSNKQFIAGDESNKRSSTYFYSTQIGTNVNDSIPTQTVNNQQQQQKQQQRSILSDSYEDLGGSIQNSNKLNKSLTPLLVRLPSGEAGYLLCPKRRNSQEQSFTTGSLPKVTRGKSGIHYFPNSHRIGRRSSRQTTNSTLLTTDTDSESGTVDLIRFAQRRNDDRSSEQARMSNRDSAGHQLDPNGSFGLKSGRDMELLLTHHLPNEFKCPSDDAGTIVTNNSLMTIDRSNSEGEGIQNSIHIDSGLGSHNTRML